MDIAGVELWLNGGFYNKTVTAITYAIPYSEIPDIPDEVIREPFPHCGSGPYYHMKGSLKWYKGSGVPIQPMDAHTYIDKWGDVHKVEAYWTQKGSVYDGNWIITDNGVRSASSTLERYVVTNGTNPKRRFHVSLEYYRWSPTALAWTLGFKSEWDTAGTGAHYEVAHPDYYTLRESYLTYVEAGMYPQWLINAYSSAYLNAANSVPQADVNLIGNIMEACDYISSFIKIARQPGAILDRLKSLKPSNMWLAYRYSYKTNQLDANELSTFIRRCNELSELVNSSIKCESSINIDDSTVLTVSFRLRLSEMIPKDLYESIRRLGFELSLSNAWDLIPYSFIVDWFTNIGDMLEFAENWHAACNLNPYNIWCTIRRNTDSGFVYMRIPGFKPLVPPMYLHRATSTNTWLMRLADSVSLYRD